MSRKRSERFSNEGSSSDDEYKVKIKIFNNFSYLEKT